MVEEYLRLILSDSSPSDHPCLDSYLDADRLRAKSLLKGVVAEDDCKVFRGGIENLTVLIEGFLAEKSKSLSILALGKIQSGKTAHMLGTIAWAVDTRIALATIFTGVTSDLNNQTVSRLHRSLGSLDESFIRVFIVPTSHEGKEYSDIKSALDEIIFARISRDEGEIGIPLPVLATLKTIQRINTLQFLHSELSNKFGSDLVSLLLDDEADQASQNSGASKREVTKIYEAISNVRKSLVRNVYLSYTATPQAVLLTERFGNLRPEFTVLVPPRTNYFGLAEMVSPTFSNNLIEIDDWNGPSVFLTEIPHSLKNAMHEYFWSSAIRFRFPNIFYREAGLSDFGLNQFMQSTQMMIHESSRVAFHKAMYQFVSDEVESYKNDLTLYCTQSMESELRDDFYKSLSKSWARMRNRLELTIFPDIPVQLDDDLITSLLDIVADTGLIIVNADKTRPTRHIEFPVETAQWELHKSWICIGGDILGRGLTIPQLLTTFFLRSAKVPNFDTVSQQMRFCGYRKNYQSFTSIWAEHQTFQSFRYMQEIESVVWNRAKQWDEERIAINKDIPKVLYASPIATRMEPTRKSVRDPDLVDSSIKGEIVFSAKKIMSPHIFRQNFGLMRRWVGDVEDHLKPIPNWYLIEDLSNADVYSLLSQWAAHASDRSPLLGAMELFGADMEALGLANVPRALFISRDVLEYPPLRDERDMQGLAQNTKFYRTVSNIHETLNFGDWAKGVVADVSESPFSAITVTHIGGTLRKLKERLEFDSTVFIIEFMRGSQGAGRNSRTISLGLALTILAPSNYEVRTIGHS